MKEGPPTLRERLRDPRMALGLCSLVLVVVLTASDLERKSPGPLTSTHLQVDELMDSDSCDACHGEGGLLRADRTMDAACGDCHDAILADVAEEQGLHGQMDTPRDCGSCHMEHHGDQIALVTPASFSAAGIPDQELFDHVQLSFLLEGKHAEQDCEACHPNALVTILPEGERRFHGLSQVCASCHDDPHEGRMVPDCVACHGQDRPFTEVATFEHARFELEGAHSQALCVDCHEPESERSVENLASRPAGDLEGPRPRDCASCHEDPHAPRFISGVAACLRLAGGETCGTCHTPSLTAFETLPDTTTAALHGAGGFQLENKHGEVECADCHTGASFEARYLNRAQDDCAACHEDPHEAQFIAEINNETGLKASACVDCHDTEGFAPSRFDVEQHALTAFPLEGRHEEAECALCHITPVLADKPLEVVALPLGLVERKVIPGSTALFRGMDTNCSSCHLNAHLVPPGVTLAAALLGDEEAFAACDRCHAPTGFSEPIEGAFDHTIDTGFTLDGAHADSECIACHARSDEPDVTGRTFGRACLQFGGPTDRCATCHADPHVLAGDGTIFPIEATPQERAQGCALCHTTDSFAVGKDGIPELVIQFDHGPRTGFPLRGSHKQADCVACHVPMPQATVEGRHFGIILAEAGPEPGSCVNCHVNPHIGGLDSIKGGAYSNDCNRCHTAEAFAPNRPGSFDHGRDTGMPLTATHADIDCGACHAERESPDCLGRSFERVKGTECADCHEDPHLGQFQIDDRDDCANCHARDGSISRFDHAKDSRFALDERHAELDCSQCHRPAQLSDGRKTIRYKPLGIECADCHGTRKGE